MERAQGACGRIWRYLGAKDGRSRSPVVALPLRCRLTFSCPHCAGLFKNYLRTCFDLFGVPRGAPSHGGGFARCRARGRFLPPGFRATRLRYKGRILESRNSIAPGGVAAVQRRRRKKKFNFFFAEGEIIIFWVHFIKEMAFFGKLL